MEQKEFEQKLSSVAEWHTPTLADNPYSTYSKTLRRQMRESMDPLDLTEELGEDSNIEDTDLVENQTLPPLVTRLKVQGEHCEDCDRWCENGRQLEMRIYNTGHRHWRKKCVTCGMFRDPRTGKYTLDCLQVSHAYRSILASQNRSRFNSQR